jgi:hypothetical protein
LNSRRSVESARPASSSEISLFVYAYLILIVALWTRLNMHRRLSSRVLQQSD